MTSENDSCNDNVSYFQFSIVLIVLLSSCGNRSFQEPVPGFIPEDTIKSVFDVGKFKKSTEPDYPYLKFTENGVYIERSLQDDYLEKIYYPDSLLGDYNRYFLSGKMMSKCRFFIKGGFLAGRSVCFDEQGNITSVEDIEAPYVISLDDVLVFMKQKGIDIHDEDTKLWRAQAEITLYGIPEGTYTWDIQYYSPDKGRWMYMLNATTGEIIYDGPYEVHE